MDTLHLLGGVTTPAPSTRVGGLSHDARPTISLLEALPEPLLLAIITRPELAAGDLARIECTASTFRRQLGEVNGRATSLPECAAAASIRRRGDGWRIALHYGEVGPTGCMKYKLFLLQSRIWPCMALSCGDSHSLAATPAGNLYAFGCNSWQQLGLGENNAPTGKQPHAGHAEERAPRMLRKSFFEGAQVVSVAAGGPHSLALTNRGQLLAWGYAGNGCLGQGPASAETFVPAPRLLTYFTGNTRRYVAVLASGTYHTACVSASGELYTWGLGGLGRLGHGDDRVDICSPRRVEAFTTGRTHISRRGAAQNLSPGDDYGYYYCDQAPEEAARGSPSAPARSFATARIVGVDCGRNTTAAVTATGQLFMCGELPTPPLPPVAVALDSGWSCPDNAILSHQIIADRGGLTVGEKAAAETNLMPDMTGVEGVLLAQNGRGGRGGDEWHIALVPELITVPPPPPLPQRHQPAAPPGPLGRVNNNWTAGTTEAAAGTKRRCCGSTREQQQQKKKHGAGGGSVPIGRVSCGGQHFAALSQDGTTLFTWGRGCVTHSLHQPHSLRSFYSLRLIMCHYSISSSPPSSSLSSSSSSTARTGSSATAQRTTSPSQLPFAPFTCARSSNCW